MAASAAVDKFFRRVCADPSLSPLFAGAELHRLAAQQRSFLIAALGGSSIGGPAAPPVSAGPDNSAVLAMHLAAALTEVGFPSATVTAVTALAQADVAPAPSATPLTRPIAVPKLPAVPVPSQRSAQVSAA
jgi:hemoglobin